MEQYVVGMDGGGTKTAVSVCDLSATERERFSSGGINYNGTDERNVEKSMREIFLRLEQSRGLSNCRAVCLGAAGIGNPEVGGRLEKLIQSCGYHGPLCITGDQQTALFGAMGELCGVILIAGTGSVCYGRNLEGREHRTGGCGHVIDDGGSGYAIGRDILSAVVRAGDGREKPTVLSGMLASRNGLKTSDEIVRFVYDKNTGKREIAALAKLLPEACAQGDGTALAIADRCVTELFLLAVPVLEQLGFQKGSLAFSGSILQKNLFIREGLLKKLTEEYPGLECVIPARDAAYGAAMMALQNSGA
ncbi:ATPase [Clostridium sp. W14A]|nr:ATPase [Clostridium sp. W14A]